MGRVILGIIAASIFLLCTGADDTEGWDDKVTASVESPKDPLKTTPGVAYVNNGDSVTLNCVPTKRDDGTNHKTHWRKGDDENWCEGKNCADEELTISGASVQDSGTYECYLTHDHVAPFASVVVYVADESVVVTPKDIIELNDTTPLNFSCKSDKSDAGIPIWRLNGKMVADIDSRFETYDNGTLYLKYSYGKNTGVYSCEISVEEDGKTQKYYNFLKVTGPGYVYQKPLSSQNLMQGDDATLKCEVYGFPTPSIVWLKQGDEEGQAEILDADDERLSFEEYRGVKNGIMKISELQFEDRANYTCNATNEIGSGAAHTFVRVKDKLAALWPFLGICAEVLVLVVIIFLYEKRRAKKEASDVDENADQKKALTEGESDVRQRSVKA